MNTTAQHDLVERAVKRFEFETEARKRHVGVQRPRRIITISRSFGAGGRQVAERLGRVLGCTVWDKEILNVMADHSRGNYQAQMLESLDEKTQYEIESLLYSISGSASSKTYMYLLPRAIHIIAQNDAIIVGRGAHLLIPDAFKVFVNASYETRVKKLVSVDGLTEEVARKQIEVHQKERESFLRALSQIVGKEDSNKHPRMEFDLEINMNHFTFQEAAELVMIAASRRFGLRAA